MGDMKINLQCETSEQQLKTEKLEAGPQLAWETPTMEDVSEQVMAQPYIRFT